MLIGITETTSEGHLYKQLRWTTAAVTRLASITSKVSKSFMLHNGHGIRCNFSLTTQGKAMSSGSCFYSFICNHFLGSGIVWYGRDCLLWMLLCHSRGLYPGGMWKGGGKCFTPRQKASTIYQFISFTKNWSFIGEQILTWEKVLANNAYIYGINSTMWSYLMDISICSYSSK